MNKQLFFSLLLITNTVTYSMKRENPNNESFALADNQETIALWHPDLTPQITFALCQAHNYKPCAIRTDIRSLYLANKFLHNSYVKNKLKQDMIDLCIPHNNSNTRSMAHALGCYIIYDKVKRLTNIVRFEDTELNEDDRQDSWYLNATTTYENKFYQRPLNRSLLYIAIDNLQLDTAQSIIDHANPLHFHYGHEQNPLLKIVEHCGWLEEEFPPAFDKELNKMTTLAHSLLKKDILPDERKENTQMTPLMHAVKLMLTDLVRLLVEYDANPQLTHYDEISQKTRNAFDFEWKKGWLQKIIDKAAKNKKFRLDPAK